MCSPPHDGSNPCGGEAQVDGFISLPAPASPTTYLPWGGWRSRMTVHCPSGTDETSYWCPWAGFCSFHLSIQEETKKRWLIKRNLANQLWFSKAAVLRYCCKSTKSVDWGPSIHPRFQKCNQVQVYCLWQVGWAMHAHLPPRLNAAPAMEYKLHIHHKSKTYFQTGFQFIFSAIITL